MTLDDVMKVFDGSDGEATRRLYIDLEMQGPVGVVAVNLFRASKSSVRAKVYRGRGYRGMAYDRKNWSIKNLSKVLITHAGPLGIKWGWGVDQEAIAKGSPHCNVLYVETPAGQVSFHSRDRGVGPYYAGKWNGVVGMGPTRICRWIVLLLTGHLVEAREPAPQDQQERRSPPTQLSMLS